VFAAGVPRFLEDLDPGVVVAGYVIMRVGAIAEWLRAAAQHREGCRCALRYAGGIAACQIGWLALLAAPDSWWVPGWCVLALAELAVPVWAERVAPTSWHPGHIGERYGLFTIIVLGESVLSATVAMQAALDAGGAFSDLVTTAIGGFLIVAGMWWIYFDQPTERLLARAREAFSARQELQSFLWGYGHYFVFASAAAVGVGLAVAADQAVGESALSDLQAALVLTLPVALYLVTVWLLHWRHKTAGPFRAFACPVTAAAIVAASWTGEPVLLSGLALAALVAVSLATHQEDAGGEAEPEAPLTEPAVM
jgi:low temperature requirement protein LtrA